MKAYLMYKDRDFDLQERLIPNGQVLTQDLGLSTIFSAMAGGDDFLLDVAKKAMLSPLENQDSILYRQAILKDCLNNPSIVRNIYAIAVESIEIRRKHYFGILGRYPSAIIYSSIEMLRFFMDLLKRLKDVANGHLDNFHSDGFKAFFAMLNMELSDEFFNSVQDHLKELEFKDGILIGAELGKDNKGINYVLHKAPDTPNSWIKRLFSSKPQTYTFCLNNRDESGARALSELGDMGINLVANTLAQSTDHILSFFSMLRTESAFYVCCLNLYEQLSAKGILLSFPLPLGSDKRYHSFRELYDVCLALSSEQPLVSNDCDAGSKSLVLITGANQGGKSTFLRSIGIAQIMMQCGMFVSADSFSANICAGLFTHFKREEDTTMSSGKLDEELARMSDIIDSISPNSMVLFNESFAATNEREGSEIARQITRALIENGVKVFFVTHLYEFAHQCLDEKLDNALFLRAERQSDGGRTFKIVEGEPLQTSYGEDLYFSIFGLDG